MPISNSDLIAKASGPRPRGCWLALCFGLTLALLPDLAAATTHTVRVIDFEFEPATLVVAPGDTVVWNVEAADHTVTADDGTFDSSPPPDMAPITTATFSHTFTAVGNHHYYCRLHGVPEAAASGLIGKIAPRSSPTDVMTGRIRVVDPGVNSLPQTPLNSTPAAGATGLSNSPLLQATAFSDADVDDSHAASQWIITEASSGEVLLDTGTDIENLTTIRLADLESSTTYSWQVRYQDDRGGWSNYSVATQFTVAEAAGEGTGLAGYYFTYNAAKDLIMKEIATRLDPTIDFEWGLGKPHPTVPANNFFIYWEGSVLPRYSEEYKFRIKADGGVRVWVDGQLVIDDPVVTTFALYRSGNITLEGGIPVAIRIQYFDTIAGASMHLRWSSESQPLEVIPQTHLFPIP